MVNVFICKECGSEDDYNTDHRCNKCGAAVIIEQSEEDDES